MKCAKWLKGAICTYTALFADTNQTSLGTALGGLIPLWTYSPGIRRRSHRTQRTETALTDTRRRVWPFHDLTESERQSTKVCCLPSQRWPAILTTKAWCSRPQPVDFSQTPIAAAFVFHDPRNWALDIQILCDVFQSGGIIGGPYDAGFAATAQAGERQRPELVFCNPDLLWKSNFERPRLGQGGFRIAFQAVYKV